MKIVIAVPCREDEPAVGETVRSVAASTARLVADGDDVRIVVCVNGSDPANGPARAALDGLDVGVAIEVVELAVASKTAAWNRLRQEDADITVFADADITVDADAIPALVDALRDGRFAAAAGRQRHVVPETLAGQVAAVPHRLRWGGLLGTLYAARTASLPDRMPDVLLDDAWLFGTIGPDRIASVGDATATVRLAATWRDLWRQRVRAEAGKAQLRKLGVELAPPPTELSPVGVVRSYPAREWPLVAVLYVVKLAARVRARFGGQRWRPAVSTKPRPDN